MKGRSVGLGRNWTVLVGCTALCVCLAVGARANTSNAVPYSESFESIAAGALLTGANGWYGVSNAVEVVEGDPMFLFGYPLDTDHTNVLELTDAVSNLFAVGSIDGASSIANPALTNGVHNPPWVTRRTFIDMMVKPVPRDSAPANLDTNVQCAVYLDTDGYLHVYHRYRITWDIYPRNAETGIVEPFAYWSALTNEAPIPTNEWFRLTIEMAYLGDPWDKVQGDPDPNSGYPDDSNQYDVFYQVRVNGGEGLTAPNGKTVPSSPHNGASVDGGSWFAAANTGVTGTDKGNLTYWLTSVATEGPGMIDDLVVATDSNALGQAKNPYDIPAGTYANAGVYDPDGDDDGDGILNWEELVAGTDPHNKDSVFRVKTQEMVGGANVITFEASNTYGLDSQVTILRTTVELASATPGDWTPIGIAAPGVTTFTDNAPPEGQAYYKPVINWTYGQ